MLPYQTYSPNQFQATQPNFNQNVMQPLPYNDRMAQAQQLQNYNQSLQQQFPSVQSVGQVPTGLIGRAVENQESITFQDVPTNGVFAFFPKNDMSEIYVRALSGEGNVLKMIYKPVEPVSDGQTNISPSNGENVKISLSDEATDALMKRFDDIGERLEKLEQTWTKSLTNSAKSSAKSKKEAESNE